MVAVSESLLKKQKRDATLATKRAASEKKRAEKAAATKATILKRAEQYVKEYRDQVG
jgi:hypothetical protein